MRILHFLFSLVGVFTIAGAVCDWDWFMESSRAQFFVNIFGRNGARAFYVLLGLFLLGLGVLGAFGVIDSSH
jgi:small neutral amino acid transporter SnatA (MarC family)